MSDFTSSYVQTQRTTGAIPFTRRDVETRSVKQTNKLRNTTDWQYGPR